MVKDSHPWIYKVHEALVVWETEHGDVGGRHDDPVRAADCLALLPDRVLCPEEVVQDGKEAEIFIQRCFEVELFV